VPRRRWIKFWPEEILYGSTVDELEPAERWVWIAFLALAGDSMVEGMICAAPGVAFTENQLTKLSKVPLKTLKNAIKKMVLAGTIHINDNGIEVVDWANYQTEWQRIKGYSHEPGGTKHEAEPTANPTPEPTANPTRNPTPLEEDKDKDKEEEKDKERVNAHFQSFWEVYPRKKSKGQAERAFLKIKPDEQLLATMLAKIEQARTSEEWLDEDGKFIPYPATWLNARGWEDEESRRAVREARDPLQTSRDRGAIIISDDPKEQSQGWLGYIERGEVEKLDWRHWQTRLIREAALARGLYPTPEAIEGLKKNNEWPLEGLDE